MVIRATFHFVAMKLHIDIADDSKTNAVGDAINYSTETI